MQNTKELRSRIKAIRTDLRMNQTEFSKLIYLSQGGYSGIESGLAPTITDKNIENICQKFNVREEWLRYGKGDMYINIIEDTDLDILYGKFRAKNDSFEQALVKVVLNLSDAQIDSLKEYILMLADQIDEE